MNRRTMLKLTGSTVGAVGLSGAGLLQVGCSPKNLSVYVQTIVGTLKELAPLLPGSAQIITNAIEIAEDFDKAYRAGQFENATALFENLAGLLSQITNDAGIDNQTVKVALAVAGIAMRAVAVLLASQQDAPGVSAAVGKHSARASLIQKLADAAAIEKAFQASKL